MWFTALGWEPIARYMNLMNYDAMCLGNHEFDKGSAGLVPFMANITCPIVDCNIDSGSNPLSNYYKPFILFKMKDEQQIEQVLIIEKNSYLHEKSYMYILSDNCRYWLYVKTNTRYFYA